MKQYFIIAAAALTVMAACTKVESNFNTPDKKVTFQAATYSTPQLRADTVSVKSEFTSFTSKAFLHADGYENITQDFFGANGETISPDNASNPSYWAPSHDYYWPKSSQSYINFIAWYDKNGDAPTTATETALSWANYAVATDDNLLYAEEAWRFKSNDFDKYDKDAVTEGVPMLFRHALAKLTIKAAADPIADGNTTWTVQLDTVKLAGVYNTGTLSLTNADPGTEHTTVAWTNAAGNVWSSPSNATEIAMLERCTSTGAETNPSALTATPTVMLDGQSVLPQTLTDAHELTVVYSIFCKYSGTLLWKERMATSVKLTDFSGSVSEWGMNKSITYTITINPQTTKVKIDPAMEDWVEVDAGTADLEN
ncbi:MAG: fimbrillin family protein [Bacteroidales bacterium]|nr:fimbrillin family protein [Bacteroidales bacterium]